MARSFKGGLAACACIAAGIAFGACGSNGGKGGGFVGDDGGGGPGLEGGGKDGPGFGDDASSSGGPMGCDAGCPMGLACDHGMCEPMQPSCVSNGDCEDDTYCLNGTCVPYGYGGVKSDPNCHQSVPPGAFAPIVKCEFSAAPSGDPFPTFLDVQATPIVVNFDKKAEGNSAIPSIVAPFTENVPGGYTENRGVLRILKGNDCSLQANLAGTDLDGDGVVDWVNSPTAVAAGDLNGDGVAEIVTYMGDFTTVAFTRNASKQWVPLWPKAKATTSAGAVFVSTIDGTEGVMPSASPGSTDIWSGPSIHDLDNDGKPEIIREGYVIDGQTGVLRAAPPMNYTSYYVGIPPVLADLYGDGNVELITGAHVWKFDGKSNSWIANATYEAGTATNPGWVGVADFDPYDGKKAPEIAVAESNTLSVYKLDHSVFMGLSVPVPGNGGGPPTIADYDHDGLPEVGLAGQDYYTVFDPDCQATPRTGGKCADRTHCDFGTNGACPDYILWSRHSQDHSSNITGSSVFDFPGAGTPEVVYADECFARVYSGFDGTVLFSQYHSSCTWIENPVVADVTGDFHSEIIVPSNLACADPSNPQAGIACGQLDANGVDGTFVGAQCQTNADCVSGSCNAGYCRCTATAQCCPLNDDTKCLEAGTQCAPPPAGTPGTGNTCRAPHPHGLQGIRVYGDAKDRWVQSRQIWNQHAYAVTHVNEDGTIPPTASWAANWTTTGLNNFRQNVPGEADGNPVGDLTAQAGMFYTCSGGSAVFEEPVCNRGTAPVAAGVTIGFYEGTTEVCSAKTATPLNVGDCETVSCTWKTPPASAGTEVNITVVADDGSKTPECDTTNDKGLVVDVFCVPPQ